MSILKQPKLLIYGGAQFLTVLAWYVCQAFLPQFMMTERGIPHADAGNVIAFHGVGFTVGGIISGSIINRFKERAIFLSQFYTFVLCGISVTLIYAHEYWQFSLLMLSYGGFVFGILTLRPLVLIDLCGQESIKDGNCVILFCNGVATLFGLPLVGFLKTKTGTLIYSFMFAAIGNMLAALCYIVIKCT